MAFEQVADTDFQLFRVRELPFPICPVSAGSRINDALENTASNYNINYTATTGNTHQVSPDKFFHLQKFRDLIGNLPGSLPQSAYQLYEHEVLALNCSPNQLSQRVEEITHRLFLNDPPASGYKVNERYLSEAWNSSLSWYALYYTVREKFRQNPELLERFKKLPANTVFSAETNNGFLGIGLNLDGDNRLGVVLGVLRLGLESNPNLSYTTDMVLRYLEQVSESVQQMQAWRRSLPENNPFKQHPEFVEGKIASLVSGSSISTEVPSSTSPTTTQSSTSTRVASGTRSSGLNISYIKAQLMEANFGYTVVSENTTSVKAEKTTTAGKVDIEVVPNGIILNSGTTDYETAIEDAIKVLGPNVVIEVDSGDPAYNQVLQAKQRIEQQYQASGHPLTISIKPPPAATATLSTSTASNTASATQTATSSTNTATGTGTLSSSAATQLPSTASAIPGAEPTSTDESASSSHRPGGRHGH